MQQDVVWTLKYFSFFDYSPTFEEILIFLTRKTNPQNLRKCIKTLKKENRLSENDNRYTLGEYNREVRVKGEEGRAKVRRLEPFLKIISIFSQIKLVGLSGSVAMMSAKKDDDIDLFIVTAQNRLWTGRFICLLVASLFGRRKFNDGHTSNKICLNLFFAESNLQIRSEKRSIYVAHEVLQMKPLIDRGNAYRSFLEANKWVFKLFPNATKLAVTGGGGGGTRQRAGVIFRALAGGNLRQDPSPRTWFEDRIEELFKVVQLSFINRHKTTEVVTNTQLWFFPDDFERKIDKALVTRRFLKPS